MTFLRFVSFLAPILAVGCSSNIVQGGPEGGGGFGGAQSSGGGQPGTGGEGGAGDDVQDGPPPTCEEFCQANPCDSPDCLDDCYKVSFPECAAEMGRYMACHLDKLAEVDCALDEDHCLPEYEAWFECITPFICDGGCAETDVMCDCAGTCPTGRVRETCELHDGVVQCQCFLEEAFVGTCEEVYLSCDPTLGCCADVIAGTGGP